MCLPPNTHLCSRIARTILFRREGRSHSQTRDTRQPTTKAALTFSDCARLKHPSLFKNAFDRRPRRREGRAHIGLDGAHSAGSTHPCSRTLSSNAFPAEEKTALTFCALSNMLDRTRTAPLKNLDSSRGVGNLQDGERVCLHSEHPSPLKNLDSS